MKNQLILHFVLLLLLSALSAHADDSKASYASHGLSSDTQDPQTVSVSPQPAVPIDFNDDALMQMDEIQARMNRMMRQLMNQSRSLTASMPRPSYQPDIDLQKTDKEYSLRVDLPGVDKDKVNIKAENGCLVLSGEREVEKEKQSEGYYRMERSYGAFSKVIPLPADADTENIHAEMKSGVLDVKIPRLSKAASAAKSIPVQ